ncbi:helix-turn-helix transcriptional regulator [Inquilinus limosus]|uniref:AlpA family transcriptional regulator n=1 Tax=Inquilinus limosus TaxID=171674 RepID=A0A211ZRB1_9PROT|nr:AlpA family phage regulatory protein [Inquilinus limosus]OWJ67822.1 hypothetical protein BWR60_07535 [Inquilinus limosus]
METLRLPEVLRIAGVSDVTLWRWEKAGRFPRRFKLGPNSVGWDRADVEAWREAKRTGTPWPEAA